MNTHTLIDKLREMGRFSDTPENREILFQAAERLEDHQIQIENITTKLEKMRAERDFAQDHAETTLRVANDLRKKYESAN